MTRYHKQANSRHQRRERREHRFANSFGLLGDNMAKLPRCADTAAMIERSVEYMDRVHPGMREARVMTVFLSNSLFGKFGCRDERPPIDYNWDNGAR